MFRKSRVKIIISIMTIMVLLIAGTFGIIYYSSYREVSSNNERMLEKYTVIYSEKGVPENDDKTPDEPSRPNGQMPSENPALGETRDMNDPKNNPAENPHPESEEDLRMYDVAVFRSVEFSVDKNEVQNIDNSNGLITDDKLTEIARSVLSSGKEMGKSNGYSFLVDKTDSYILVAFLDNTDTDETFNTLIRFTLIFSCVSFAVIFVIALWLSKLIIRPLEKSHELQKRFVSDAGHELKTPIAVIGTNAEVLGGEIGENKWLSNIRYESNRMSLLIKELLSLVKADKASEKKEQVNLSRIVVGEILPFESVAYEKGIEVNYEKVEDDVIVNGNQSRLSQLVSILIDNAISYAYPNTEARVSLVRDRGKAVLSVMNNAEEISAEKAEHIFDRFYRIDDARTSEGNHYGLGLAIAKSIVDYHDGEISLCSKDDKVTFTVTFKSVKS